MIALNLLLVALAVVGNTPSNDDSLFHLFSLIGSFVISIILIAIIFGIGRGLIRPMKPPIGNVPDVHFSDIFRDENWYPSLARFQFLIWTWIILFVVVSIFWYKFFNGIYIISGDVYNIPFNLFALMGMTVAVPVASGYISSIKYSKMISTGKRPTNLPSFGTMLAENDKPELARFQMFAWTWIAVIFYLISFGFQTSQTFQDPSALKIPDIPTAFVILMGISQGAYVGTKLALSEVFSVTSVKPDQIDSTIAYDGVIYGSNFGKESVSLNLHDMNDNFVKRLTILQPMNDNMIKLDIPANTITKSQFPGDPKDGNKSYCYIKVGKSGQFSDRNVESRLMITK